MKKFIIIALALIAVAVGVYLYKNKSSDGDIVSSITNKLSGSSSQVMEYVPADTILFGGNLEAMDYDKLMAFSRNFGLNFEVMGELFNKEEFDMGDAPDGAKFVFGFVKKMMGAASSNYPKTMGVPSETDGAIYTVGALPVFRFSLDGSNTFQTMVETIEKENQITAKVGSLDGFEYREYSFGEDVPVTLVLSTHNNQAVMTLNTLLDDAKDLKLALGIEKPAKSFSDSPRLAGLVNKFGYEGHQLFLMDNLGIVEGITNPRANHFGGMLDDLLVAYNVNNGPGVSVLAEYRTPECQSELTAFVGNWPTISAGYTNFDANSASYKMVVEGSNAGLLDSLQKLHGHLSPAMANKDMLFSMGMGFNMAEMTGVLTDVWKRLTKDPYNCSSLADMQNALKGNNPVMQLGMVSGMLGGIKGFGFGLVDMDVSAMEQAQNNPMAAADSVSLIMTLSADDPMALVQLAGQFQPMLGGIELEEGAAPKALPLPLPVEVNGSLRGHDLVLSFGDKANAMAANLDTNSSIDYNGLFSVNYDMGRYFGMINQAMAMDPNQDADAEEFQRVFNEMFKNVKGRYTDKTSFTKNGLEVTMEFDLN
ncbi:hypothetical protein [Kangiella sp. HZ709]|uniref:hypothetical protein n=1 Tax=Kangiella sp. HZ709 TaxID=2666328 RepID=UPI0012B01136|nr:hypothetical protein [Kangiella sp. HZ709]MRX26776.1 hypothetical protein [Kangiella sp. HZ709]